MNGRASFPPDPASVAAARRFVNSALGAHPEEVRERATLMVSELATNAVKHARTGFTVTVDTRPDHVRVEVTDRGSGRPRKRRPATTEPTGRGLLIVDAMSDDWGSDEYRDEKTVWFTVRVGAQLHASDGAAQS